MYALERESSKLRCKTPANARRRFSARTSFLGRPKRRPNCIPSSTALIYGRTAKSEPRWKTACRRHTSPVHRQLLPQKAPSPEEVLCSRDTSNQGTRAHRLNFRNSRKSSQSSVWQDASPRFRRPKSFGYQPKQARVHERLPSTPPKGCAYSRKNSQ